MIIYFSATGNSRYTAVRVAEKSGDKLFSIADALRNDQMEVMIPPGENLGIITPVYGWGLPAAVSDFFKRCHLSYQGRPYTWYICTYGTTTGQTGYYIDRLLKRFGLSLDARFSIPFPDTWTPVFDLSDKEKVKQINAKAEGHIDKTIDLILGQKKGNFTSRALPLFLSDFYHDHIFEKERRTINFHLNDRCIGCGLCEKKCPVSAIRMENGRPRWITDKCSICLGCLHRCPVNAIEYRNSIRHGQYVHPNVKLKDL